MHDTLIPMTQDPNRHRVAHRTPLKSSLKLFPSSPSIRFLPNLHKICSAMHSLFNNDVSLVLGVTFLLCLIGVAYLYSQSYQVKPGRNILPLQWLTSHIYSFDIFHQLEVAYRFSLYLTHLDSASMPKKWSLKVVAEWVILSMSMH